MKLSRAAGSYGLDVYSFKKAAFRPPSERYSRENKHMRLFYSDLNRVAGTPACANFLVLRIDSVEYPQNQRQPAGEWFVSQV